MQLDPLAWPATAVISELADGFTRGPIQTDTLVGAAVIAGATYATLSWWDHRSERERAAISPYLWAVGLMMSLRGIALAVSFLAVFGSDPDGGDGAANASASILVYGGPILIVLLIALWIAMSAASKAARNDTTAAPTRRWIWQDLTDAERQAAYEARMALLIAEYDRIGFYDPTRYDRDGNFYPKGELGP